MRRLVRAPPEERRAAEEEERQQLTEACRSLSLEALAQHSHAGEDLLRVKLDEIFAQLASTAEQQLAAAEHGPVYTAPTLPQIQFPELFVY